jgi:hypothetical protein
MDEAVGEEEREESSRLKKLQQEREKHEGGKGPTQAAEGRVSIASGEMQRKGDGLGIYFYFLLSESGCVGRFDARVEQMPKCW